MRSHLAGIAALIPDGIDVYATAAERPDYDPADWSAPWSSAQQAAWELPDRYVVLTAPTMLERSLTIDGLRRGVESYFQATAVGLSDQQARWVHEQIRATLNPAGGGRPDVPGYSAWTHLSAEGIHSIDREVKPYRYFAVDTYKYRATPTV